ncbi:MAG: SMP-30/gluconolactonase/LRE family protein [Thermomicrobiales bacterium]
MLAKLRTASPLADGAPGHSAHDANGAVIEDAALNVFGVTAAYHVNEPGIDHQVASPFWAFMNASDLVYEDGVFLTASLFPSAFYATGLPVTEAYWAQVQVDGTDKDVLIQCFERRCLTYTPDNPLGWQVEAGNVGQHYYHWRYGQDDGAEPTPEPTAEPDPSPTAEPDPSATPEPEPTQTPDPDPLPEAVVDYTLAAALGGDQSDFNEFDRLGGITTRPDGTVIVVDKMSERVQKFSPDGSWISSFSGTGQDNGPMEYPEDVEVDGEGRIWILDRGNSRIVQMGVNSQVVKSIGNVGKPNLRLLDPAGFTIGPDGYFYVADTGHRVVKVYKPDGNFAAAIGEPGTGDGQFVAPSDVVVHESGNIIVADQETSRIQMFGPEGEFIFAWGTEGSGEEEFTSPTALALDEVGRLYIVDLGNHRIRGLHDRCRVHPDDRLEGGDPGQLNGPVDVVADNHGKYLCRGSR